MKHTTLYGNVARSPCAYCKKKGVSLTWRQIKSKKCLGKNCWYLVKYDHEVWHQRELTKKRKKEHKEIDELFMY